MKTVLIAGGSGMIGQTLSKFLKNKGFNVLILSRSKKKSRLFILESYFKKYRRETLR